MVAAGISAANPERPDIAEIIAFLSCDGDNATQEVNELMGDKPKAILLYSVDGNACSLEGNDLNYQSIYTWATPERRGTR